MITLRTAGLAGLILTFPALAFAQLCQGRTPITASTPLTVGVDLEFNDASTGMAAAVSSGGDRGFATGVVGLLTFDALDQNALVTVVEGGAQLPVDAAGRVQVCPTGQVGFAHGPNNVPLPTGALLDSRALTVGGGFSVGVAAVDAEIVQVVPTARVGFRWVRQTASIGESSESMDASFATVGGGVGIILSQRFAITPTLSRSIGAPGDDSTSFSLALTVGFPHR